MKKLYLTIIKTIILTGVAIVFVLMLFLIFIQISGYTPDTKENLTVNGFLKNEISDQTRFSIVSWNLGYCGLGKEMDFFYDGGQKVRPNRLLSKKYLSKNLEFIQSFDDIDFWFFQEVDKNSRRSFHVDQAEQLEKHLGRYSYSFALNYKVPFVPLPLKNPMGPVYSGIMTFGRFSPYEAIRVSYPNIAKWPQNLFLLDRCFILFRYKLKSGKDLVLINTHNSYYISEDSLRMIELNILRKTILQEYKNGNYVIAGGDWNKYPPHFFNKTSIPKNRLQSEVNCLDKDFLPEDWIYAFSPSVPTNRDLKFSYSEEKSKWAVIDFFIVSPNIKIESCKTYSLDFENSDHNPVKLIFSLVKKDQ